jgi:hypothetical protein
MFNISICDNRHNGTHMQPVDLESKSLATVRYDPAVRQLEVAFRTGKRYLYFLVPSHYYQRLLQAESKGAYFNRHIRNRFPYQQLSDSSAPVVLSAPPKTK